MAKILRLTTHVQDGRLTYYVAYDVAAVQRPTYASIPVLEFMGYVYPKLPIAQHIYWRCGMQQRDSRRIIRINRQWRGPVRYGIDVVPCAEAYQWFVRMVQLAATMGRR